MSNILSPQDPIVAFKQTTKGQPNVLAEASEADEVAQAIDGSGHQVSQSRTRGQDLEGNNPSGDNTGFVVTPGGNGM